MKLYREKPERFIRDTWPNVVLYPKLEEIVRAIANNSHVLVQSGHGTGKTWTMARMALWFLFCFHNSKVITTAPTWGQVKNQLWQEIRSAYHTARYPLGGKILQTDLKVNDNWFALGLSPRGDKSEEEWGSNRMQGYHAENLLVIGDEAPGLDSQRWRGMSSLVVGKNNKQVMIGNPMSATGDFYEASKNPELWTKVKISCFDHPNVQEQREVIPGAVTYDWVERRRLEWGEESSLWKTKVLGDFAQEGTDTLIFLSWIEACVANEAIQPSKDPEQRVMGVDVARFGTDKTVFCRIYGKFVLPFDKYQGKDTNWTIGFARKLVQTSNLSIVGVDDIGLGGGVVDGLDEALKGKIDVVGVNFSAAATEPERFVNTRAESYWNLRELIRHQLIRLPNDPELINQLASIRYRFTRRGIAIEEKDAIKKRLGKSPDEADALAIAAGLRREYLAQMSVIVGTERKNYKELSDW